MKDYYLQPFLFRILATVYLLLVQFYKEKMLKDECHTLVGYHLNQIISTATIYYYDILPSNENSKGKVGQITNVWVDENYRHLGIGRYMVEYLIENYQKDVGMIFLNSSKEGINMYLHLGFKKKNSYCKQYYSTLPILINQIIIFLFKSKM